MTQSAPSSTTGSGGTAPRNDRWLLGFCLARAAFSMEMTTFTAAAKLLEPQWGMTAGQTGSVTSAHHVGFLVSLFTVGLLGDRYGAKRVYLVSSGFAAVSALLFAGLARDYLSAVLLYGLLGLCSGGSYTPGLAILAQRYPPRRRGRAIGFYIAASAAGYAASLLLSGVMISRFGWQAAFWVTCAGPSLGLVLGASMLRRVDNVIPERAPEAASTHWLKAVLGNRAAMVMIAAYVFHSWELLGIWAWIPYYLSTVYGGGGAVVSGALAAGLGATFAALGYLAGIGGPILGGSLSDRLGRGPVIVMFASLSAVTTLTLGWLAAAPFWIVVSLAVVVQFLAVGDSPVLSTALTEVVPARYLGAAYALRSVLGFGAGAVSPWVFGLVLDWGRADPAISPIVTWGTAFAAMGLGGLLAPLVLLLFWRPGKPPPSGGQL